MSYITGYTKIKIAHQKVHSGSSSFRKYFQNGSCPVLSNRNRYINIQYRFFEDQIYKYFMPNLTTGSAIIMATKV